MSDVGLIESARFLTQEKIGVIPTDTIYGLVGSALSRGVVERIYRVRGRRLDKPFIVLISSIDDLKRFGINPDKKLLALLTKYWPASLSVVLPVSDSRFEYLHRDTKSLAFRMPHRKELLELLVKTGPLVAPSANPEGKSPAHTIEEARAYFGDSVDFYVDGGKLEGPASTLVQYENGKFITLREGVVKVAS